MTDLETSCPHGDPTCPCPDDPDGYDVCHYEGLDAWGCPNPTLGIRGQVNPHCHMEGCDWHMRGCAGRPNGIDGVCGLQKLAPDETAFHLAVPGTRNWFCGWLRNTEVTKLVRAANA